MSPQTSRMHLNDTSGGDSIVFRTREEKGLYGRGERLHNLTDSYINLDVAVGFEEINGSVRARKLNVVVIFVVRFILGFIRNTRNR
ncbi:hypothetical protein TNCV_600921 [Trichonephila clavipes]|nr:hypothetical protein TNCV_600921 [Trichonephila clavipes]